MSPDETLTPSAQEHDLDEDLFNFDEIAGGSALADDEDADLDEIFATFQAQEDDDDDTEIGLEPLTPSPAEVPDFTPEDVAPAATPEAPASTPTPAAAPVAAAPAAVPAGAPAQFVAAPGVSSGGMPRTVVWIFLAMASANILLAIVMIKVAGSMSSGVEEMAAEVSSTVGEFKARAVSELEAHRDGQLPVVSPDPANHEVFETASTMIEEGRYAEARRALYALLAVVDRMDPVAREDVEARANYLIAHAFQREAHDRIGGRR